MATIKTDNRHRPVLIDTINYIGVNSTNESEEIIMSKSTKAVKDTTKAVKDTTKADSTKDTTKAITDRIKDVFDNHKYGVNGESIGYKNITDRTAIIPVKVKAFELSDGLKKECKLCGENRGKLSAKYAFISCPVSSPDGLPVKLSETNRKGRKNTTKAGDNTCKYYPVVKAIKAFVDMVGLPAYSVRSYITGIITKSELIELLNYRLEKAGFPDRVKITDIPDVK